MHYIAYSEKIRKMAWAQITIDVNNVYCLHVAITWQWSRRRSLTPSTKRVSHRGSLLKGVAVQGVLYQSISNAKLTGRKKLGRKMCTSNRDDRKLENTVKQSQFKHLGELHKEWTVAGVSASRVTTLRYLQEKGYQTTSEPETLSEASYLGWGEKELDCCSGVQSLLFRLKYILHFIWKSRSQSLEEEWRDTESMLLEVQCEVSSLWWFGLPCHLLVLVYCVFWSPQYYCIDAVIHAKGVPTKYWEHWN